MEFNLLPFTLKIAFIILNIMYLFIIIFNIQDWIIPAFFVLGILILSIINKKV